MFSLTLALRSVGDELWERVGREPSGDPFNSLVQLEHEHGIPRNPMINAGALVVCDALLERGLDPGGAVLQLLSELTGDVIDLDAAVLESEGRTGHRNTAMAFLMSAAGNLHCPVEDVMDACLRHARSA